MKRLLRLLIATSVTVLLFSGCTRVDVVAPELGAVYLEVPETFSVGWEQRKSVPRFIAILNGKNVSSHFSVTTQGASAKGSDLQSLLQHGYNRFVIKSPALHVVEFQMDWQGPSIHLNAEKRFDGVRVRGYVQDPSPIETFFYRESSGNTQPIELVDNQFDIFLSDANGSDYTFTAIDSLEQKTVETFSRRYEGDYKKTQFDDSLALRLGMSGLDFVGAIAPDILDELDPLTMLREANPIVERNILGVIYRVHALDGEFDLVELGIAPSANPYMELDLDALLDIGYLTIQLCIQLQDLDLGIFGTIVFPVLCFEQADLSAWVDISASIDIQTTNDGSLSVESFYPDVRLWDVDLSFTRIEDSFDAFIRVIVGDFLADLFALVFDGIRAGIVNAISEVLQFINGAIEAIFQVDLMSYIIIFFAEPGIDKIVGQVALAFDVNIDLGNNQPKNVRATTLFNNIYRDRNDLVVFLDTVLQTFTPADVPDPFGIRNDGSAMLPSGKAPDGNSYDFNFSISTTFLHQVFDTAYHAGLFSQDIVLDTRQTSDALLLYLGLEKNSNIAELRFRVLPASPPYIEMQANEEAMGRLVWQDLTLLVQSRAKQGETAFYEDLLAIQVNLSLPFDLLVAPGENHLGLNVNGYADIDLVRYQSERILVPEPFIKGLITTLESQLQPPLIGVVNELLSNVQLPSVFGLSVDPRAIWPQPQGNSFMVAGELVESDD